MKKCKYCKSEIEKDAKICPVCKKKQKQFPIWLRIFGVFLAIVGVVGALSSCEDYINSTSENTKDTDKYITLEEFNKIQNGMSYEEVKNIIGSDGTVVSDTEIEGFRMIIYSWYGEDEISNANFNFQNNKLTNKTQIGLK